MNKIIATPEDYEVGKWLSAALEDKMVCQDMKDDITRWFDSKEWETTKSEPKATEGMNIQWEKTLPEREKE